MITIRNAHKAYGYHRVLRGIDADIGSGEFVSVLGKNGAGKSTLLKAVASIAPLDAGRITVREMPTTGSFARSRAIIGYLGHESFLTDELSAYENLRFYGRCYGVDRLEQRIESLLREANLHLVRNEPVRSLSRGMERKLALARCMIHDPEVYLLDEPFAGLDAAASRTLIDTLESLHRRGRAILLVTHDLDHAIEMSDTVWVLSHGTISHRIGMHSDGADLLRRSYDRWIEGTA